MMWNPPWTLTLLLPFGLLPYETAQFVWFVFHVLILFLGSQALWGWYGGSPAKPWYPLLAVLSFARVYFALLLGQIGPLILLGIIGFLAGVQKKAWKLSGASLVLVAIKPHLLYLLWLALLLWVVKERKWRLAIAFGASFIAAAVVPLLFRPDLYAQYLRLIQHGVGVTRPLEWATPALGTALAQLFSVADAWVRWVPGFIGALWLFWYWSRDGEWNWPSEAPLLLAASITTTSFAWTFDHVVLLPALIQGACWINSSQASRSKATIVGIHIALAASLIAMKLFVRNDFWYFWSAPAYLLLYIYARASLGAIVRAQKGLRP